MSSVKRNESGLLPDFMGWTPQRAEDEDMRAWGRYISTLTIPEKSRVLEGLRQSAEKHFAGSNTIEIHNDLCLVVSDANEAVSRAIAQDFGVATHLMHQLFDQTIPPQPQRDPVYIFVYSGKSSYTSLRTELGASDLAVGFYDPPGMIAMHLELETSNEALSNLLHESVHAYLDQFVVKPGVVIPLWVNEGLAEYLANSDIKDGRIEPGAHRQRAITYSNPMLSWRGPSASYLGAEDVKKAVSSGKAIPLADLVAAERNEFYGERYRLYYSEAWLLVHFLIKGRPGWAAEQFPRFLLLIAEGFHPSASSQEAYGQPPIAMEDEFRAYVRGF